MVGLIMPAILALAVVPLLVIGAFAGYSIIRGWVGLIGISPVMSVPGMTDMNDLRC